MYLLNLVIRHMIKVLEHAARRTEPHARGARKTTPDALSGEKIQSLYDRGLISPADPEFRAEYRVGVDPSSTEGVAPVLTAGLGLGLGLPQGAVAGSRLAEAYLSRHAAGLEENRITMDHYTTEDLQRVLNDIGLGENRNPVTESAEDPSAEIDSCPACGHPQHREEDRRCAVLVPSEDRSQPLYPNEVCGCVFLSSVGPEDSGQRFFANADHRDYWRAQLTVVEPEPEPEIQAEAEPGEFGPDPVPEIQVDRTIRETDAGYNDLQTYLEGTGQERDDAARRLDQREVDCGQLSPSAYRERWGATPVLTYPAHQLWCPRYKHHAPYDCTEWGTL